MITIKSFDELHELVRENGKGHYIYRGEDASNYALRPKFGRSGASAQKDALTIEKGILSYFTRLGAPHVVSKPTNEWEWLAVGQHFGLATRLLDWTENPLVAAFFATKNKLGVPTDRVIYSIDQTSLDDADINSSPFDIERVVKYEPKHIDTRITAQAGLFTAHPKPHEEFSSSSMQRWVISGDVVVNLFVTLKDFGIHAASMFPGLDGIAEHINLWNMRGYRRD